MNSPVDDIINLISSDEDVVQLPKAGPSSKSRKGKEVPRGERRKSF